MEHESLHSEHNLDRLSTILNYELSSIVLFLFSFLTIIFLFVATAAAIIFIPIMLHILYKEKKIGWIIAFLILVILPLVVILALWTTVPFLKPLILLSLGFFYFYCFLLRFEVNNWAKEMRARNDYLLRKKAKEEESRLLSQYMNDQQ